MATWPWVGIYYWAGVTIEEFPHLTRWLDAIEPRPAVHQGISVPTREWFEILTGQGGDADQFAEHTQTAVKLSDYPDFLPTWWSLLRLAASLPHVQRTSGNEEQED
jgi:hypothetical protein